GLADDATHADHCRPPVDTPAPLPGLPGYFLIEQNRCGATRGRRRFDELRGLIVPRACRTKNGDDTMRLIRQPARQPRGSALASRRLGTLSFGRPKSCLTTRLLRTRNGR